MYFLNFFIVFIPYSLIAGLLVGTIAYFSKENVIYSRKELWWLLLFPLTGFGNWRYQRMLRGEDKGRAGYPKKWFIYRAMTFFNLGYVLTMFIFLLTNEPASASAGFSDDSAVGMLFDFGGILLDVLGEFLMGLLQMFGLLVVAVVLVGSPMLKTNSLEKEFLRKKAQQQGSHQPSHPLS